ncbi:leucine-rich repeat flightless-interacting protein 2 isoform X15 [Coturnix japonica]|uniref:leucine-rich repeat flightless-interacting protein 2 isoform X15 n=1 Tax=Coturnix japonica TaxID=93934 RepID=UPI0013A5DF6B|nr:leucine-rich repeat flightless-interacting protein 2 isoform X15 [Coturnix japonica]
MIQNGLISRNGWKIQRGPGILTGPVDAHICMTVLRIDLQDIQSLVDFTMIKETIAALNIVNRFLPTILGRLLYTVILWQQLGVTGHLCMVMDYTAHIVLALHLNTVGIPQEQAQFEVVLCPLIFLIKVKLLLTISVAPTAGEALFLMQMISKLEEKSEKSHSEIFSRPSSRNSIPLSGNSSRRGSGDTSSLLDPDASLSELRDIYDLKDQIHDVEGRYMQGLKELKDSLAEVEEKYKKAMVSNAQLDNEKNNLVYQVDTLKDVLVEKEEQIAELSRENDEKIKELEREKHACKVLQHKLDELKEGLRQRDELIEENQRMQQNIDCITKEVFDLQETINWKDKKIGALERQKDYFDCIKKERDELREELADLKETMKRGEKHGLVIIPDGTPNGDINHESAVGAITVVSQEAAQVLESAGEGPLDVRLRKLAGEKEELLSQVRKLKMQLEEERQKYSKSDGMNPDIVGLENGSDLQLIEMQRDANRQISEYKFRLSKAEQDITTLEQNIGRLEGQVARYKSAAENAEKVEDELKAEKRKLQRELRTALDKIEEMEMTNSHLMKRLEKMKANRTALLSQQ